MFEYCKFYHSRVAAIIKYQLNGRSITYYLSKKVKKRKRCLSYQTVLARLACKIQHLNVSQIKIAAKNIAKVFSLHRNAQIKG